MLLLALWSFQLNRNVIWSWLVSITFLIYKLSSNFIVNCVSCLLKSSFVPFLQMINNFTPLFHPSNSTFFKTELWFASTKLVPLTIVSLSIQSHSIWLYRLTVSRERSKTQTLYFEKHHRRKTRPKPTYSEPFFQQFIPSVRAITGTRSACQTS